MADTASPIDWQLAEDLYIKGFTPKMIAQQLGNGSKKLADHVSVRAMRGKWRERITKTAQIVSVTKTITSPVSQARSSLRTELHGKTKSLAESIPEAKKGMPIRSLKGIADLTLTTALAAQKIEGWAEASETQVVTVEGIRALTPDVVMPLSPMSTDGQPVLDVPEVPPDPPVPAEQQE